MEKKFNINGREIKVSEYQLNGNSISFLLDEKKYEFSLVGKDGENLIIEDHLRYRASVGSANKEGEAHVMINGKEAFVSLETKKMKKTEDHQGGLTSPMPGKIFKILKGAGTSVKKGEAILILEAMKMEHSIRADKDGKIKKINFLVGELVQGGVVLAEMES